MHQLKSPLSDPNLLSKSTSKCEHCGTRFTSYKTVFENFMKWGLKGGISIDTDSGPLGYVLWCCGSRSQDFFTFIQIGPGHTMMQHFYYLVCPLDFWMIFFSFYQFSSFKLNNCGHTMKDECYNKTWMLNYQSYKRN